MMSKFKKILMLFLFVGITASFINVKPCFAASAKVELTSNNSTVTIGDTVYVYININSETTFTDFVANLAYDSNVLEYTGGAQKITGGNGLLKINDIDVMEGSTKRKYAMKFKTLKVGNCKMALEDPVVYDESGNELSVSSDELTLKVKAKNTASTNANLKSLTTNPSIEPSFNKKTLEYNVSVDSSTDELFIVADPEDKKATVSITGNDSLKEGKNKVVIKVLAESGNVIEYTINVNKEKKAETTPTITPTPDTDTISSSSVKIVQNGADQYLVIGGSYKLVDLEEGTAIPKGYVKTEITISGETVTAYVPNDNMQDDFALLYVENSDGEKGFYQYDKVEKTIQRFTESSVGNTKSDNQSKEIQQYKSNLSKAAIAIAILSAVALLLLFTTVRTLKVLSKKRKRRR